MEKIQYNTKVYFEAFPWKDWYTIKNKPTTTGLSLNKRNKEIFLFLLHFYVNEKLFEKK